MARKLISEIYDKARFHLSDTDSSNYETAEDKLYSFIDDAAQDVYTELRLSKKEDLIGCASVEIVSGQSYYEIPDDFVTSDYLEYLDPSGSKHAFYKKKPFEIDAYERDGLSTSKHFYCLEGIYFRIYPAISGAGDLNLRYYYAPETITAAKSGSEIEVKDNLIVLIAIKAAIYARGALDDDVSVLMALYRENLSRTKREMVRISDSPSRFRTIHEFYANFGDFTPSHRRR